jgi:hypothetical protein
MRPGAGRGLACVGLLLCLAAATAASGAEKHWSLQPRRRAVVPTITAPTDAAWIRNPIDAFILAKLRVAGLDPAPEADRRTLIRRVTFDLTGLPPTPEEVAAFVANPAPDAYERLVDRLLASPHHGEQWGQHWLDVVRYAESEGFEYDRQRPGAWRYRDYIIAAFNADIPLDRFIREQLAGDEIDPESLQCKTAAGLFRLGPVRRNAGNPEVALSRHEILAERTDVLGAVFLGMTVGCARCHDHKFDAFSQADYYRLQAFLAATQEQDLPLAPPDVLANWKKQTAKVQEEIHKIQQAMETAGAGDRRKLDDRLAEARRRLPAELPVISSVHDVEAERTAIHVLKRGDPARQGKQVGPRFPSALVPADAPELSPTTPKPRTLLARWLTEPDHPLTARVLVNRIWQYHFGTGIVSTPNDFGVNGSRPSHPELLDHLANTLVDSGWRLKPLHRLIVLSSTYRLASRSPDAEKATRTDPDDRLLWRFPRRRLAAEELRDAMLAVAGTLNLQGGGPSVVVPVDPELVHLLYHPADWQVTPDPTQHHRRSVYLLAKRNLRLPFGEAFDQPDLQTSCPRRETSTHAGQALELLNGPLANDLAGAFADRLAHETAPGVARIERAFLLGVGRPPTQRETDAAVRFLAEAPLSEFALAIFNLHAFLYID